MYDLVCIVPLYGVDCENVSLRMISSLAIQKTSYKVKYLFYYDKTVSNLAIDQVKFIMSNRDISYDVINSEQTCSGYKRNLGLDFAEKNSRYVWCLDQDDYLLREDAIQNILRTCFECNIDIFKIKYNLPDIIDEQNRNIISVIPTMPWQYVVRTDLIDDCRFNEENEYGSDIPYSIKLLVKTGYIKVNDKLTINYLKLPKTFSISLYFYNYLNPLSYMTEHATAQSDKKNKEVEYALGELRKLREQYENR